MNKSILDEIKAINIKIGDTFTVSNSIGKFNEGDKVTVDDVRSFGNDIELHLSNEEGDKDTFYLDRDDDFGDLA
jgi:hypothetical protein